MSERFKSLLTIVTLVSTLLTIVGFTSFVSYRFAKVENAVMFEKQARAFHSALPGHIEAMKSIGTLEKAVTRLDTTLIHLTDLIETLADREKETREEFREYRLENGN